MEAPGAEARVDSSAVGARIEAPKAARGWGVGRGCPLPTEEGLGRG